MSLPLIRFHLGLKKFSCLSVVIVSYFLSFISVSLIVSAPIIRNYLYGSFSLSVVILFCSGVSFLSIVSLIHTCWICLLLGGILDQAVFCFKSFKSESIYVIMTWYFPIWSFLECYLSFVVTFLEPLSSFYVIYPFGLAVIYFLVQYSAAKLFSFASGCWVVLLPSPSCRWIFFSHFIIWPCE